MPRVGLLAVHEHLHPALLGPDHHGLLAHASHHVEGRLGLPAEGELQHVLLDALLDHLPELLGDPEEAIGRAEPVQALVGPAVVVVLHPESDPLTRRVEALELGPLQELLPDGLPEALDLPQRHGVVGPALQVVDVILPKLGLEPGGAPPAGELPALVGEHLLGDAVLGHRPAVELQDVLRGLAAEDVEADHVARVVVDKPDQVGVLAAEAEGEDVGLPELVGRGPLKGAGGGRVGLGLGAAPLEQGLRVEGPADRLPAHGEEQDPPQELADLLDPELGVALLERDGLPLDRGGHLRLRPCPRLRLQAGFPLGAVPAHPGPQRTEADPELAGDLVDGEAFLQAEPDGLAPEVVGVGLRALTSGPPPPLACGVSLPLALNFAVPFHGSHSLGILLGTPGIGVSPVLLNCSCS